VDAILLDALGTLLELRPPAPALRAVLAERCAVSISAAEAEQGLAAEISYYRAHFQEGRDQQSIAALRERCAEVLRAALPRMAELDSLTPPEMTDVLLAALRFEPFPEVAATLETARARGVRLVVVSNWDASLPETLERVGLAALLDGVLTSAQVGVRKPDPLIFHRALALAGVAPEEALHVGDSLVEDIDGARAAGLRAVLIRRGGEPGPAQVETVASLTELGPLLGWA
jgi:putative hydrolase of the HAD superfamily